MNSIWSCICGDKIREPIQVRNNTATMSYLSLPGQASSVNKPRAQVVLAPRHGLMDWIRKMSNTPNLSGTDGKILNVTEEELAKHNTRTDCWTAICGHVYNLTPYLDYHPGGVDEIMKGAGIDSTTLFQDIHSWVNFASMLEKCLVGRLVTKPSQKELSNRSKLQQNRLRFDFRQTNSKAITLCMHITCLKLTEENVFVHLEHSKTILILIFMEESVHTVAIELSESVTNDFTVRVTSDIRTQIEIELNKKIDEIWKTIGKFLPNHLSSCSVHDFEPVYFPTTLVKRIPITHDTDWYAFSIPSSVFIMPPIGYHVRLRRPKEGIIVVKPYTVVHPLNKERNSSTDRTIELLIKHYPDGVLTTALKKLNIGDTIEMSSFEGTFDASRINACHTLILIVAGTGFTPIMRIINYAIEQTKIGKVMNVILLFFNKAENDILCRDDLEVVSKQYRFMVYHILSQPDASWTGETGFIRRELLERLLPSPPTNDQDAGILVCICGPTHFTTSTIDLLKELNYHDNHIHAFRA